MIKHYCDACGTKITKENKQPDKFIGKKIYPDGAIKRELIVCLSEVYPCGDKVVSFCKYCLIDAINTMDDRPVSG